MNTPAAAISPPAPTRGLGPHFGRRGLVTWETAIKRQRHRQERESGLDRAVAQRALQVVGEEQEQAEQADPDGGHGDERATPVAVEDHPQREQRVLGAPLDEDEGGQEATPPIRNPRVVVLVQRSSGRANAVDRGEQAAGHGDHPGDVQGSRWPGACCTRRTIAPGTATAAMARLTNSVHRQDRYEVRTPPRMRPIAPPAPAMAP